MPHVIQLLHPGKEHTFDKTEKYPLKNWNVGEHKRKFVKYPGKYVENGEIKTDNLLFWCEWEPPSIVGKTLINNYKKIPLEKINNYSDFPKFRHDELFFYKTNGGENTDPCIFGSLFKYGLCKQSRYNKQRGIHYPTQLTNLDNGSIILFGSYKKNKQTEDKLFVIDTVFVVNDGLEYNTGSDLKNSNDSRITPQYHEIFTRFVDYNNVSRRLYFGATYTNQVGDMYSFVPAKLYNEKDSDFGFERPNLVINKIISPGLNSNFKSTEMSLKNCKAIWDEIVIQIEAQGLIKAVNFATPKEIQQEEQLTGKTDNGCKISC